MVGGKGLGKRGNPIGHEKKNQKGKNSCLKKGKKSFWNKRRLCPSPKNFRRGLARTGREAFVGGKEEPLVA